MVEPICVALACDDSYAQHVAAAISSAVINRSRVLPLDVHVLATELRPSSSAKLRRLADRHGDIEVTLHELSIDRFSRWKRSEHISQAAYLRLLMCDLIPKDRSRLIYLDADTICVEPLDELWSMNLDGAVLGATRDTSTPVVSSPRGIASFEQLGLDAEMPYFNSGVLLIDAAKWRDADPLQFAEQYVARFGEVQRALDQEILNVCFARQWVEIDTKWNVSPRLFNIENWKDPRAVEAFEAIAKQAREAPAIVHFLGPKKPWHFRSSIPWRDQYFEAVVASGWFDMPGSFARWRVREFGEDVRRRFRKVRRRLRPLRDRIS